MIWIHNVDIYGVLHLEAKLSISFTPLQNCSVSPNTLSTTWCSENSEVIFSFSAIVSAIDGLQKPQSNQKL